MLTYTHNHAPGTLLWWCFCHTNEKQNSESFFNYDVNVTSVITMELNCFSLRCWFLCMMSLAVTSSMLKTSTKFWCTSFKLWLRPCVTTFNTEQWRAFIGIFHERIFFFSNKKACCDPVITFRCFFNFFYNSFLSILELKTADTELNPRANKKSHSYFSCCHWNVYSL